MTIRELEELLLISNRALDAAITEIERLKLELKRKNEWIPTHRSENCFNGSDSECASNTKPQ